MSSAHLCFRWETLSKMAVFRRLAVAVFFTLPILAGSVAPPASAQPQLAPVVSSASFSGVEPDGSPGRPAERAPAVSGEPKIPDGILSIYFPRRLATVNDEEKEKLRDCAEKLKRNPKEHVLLSSYSDDLGSKSYNLAIAEQRLTAVGSALRSLGVASRQIRRNRSNSVKATANACRSENCRQQMRRVDISCGT